MTLQRRMEATLAKTSIPHKDIHCYGNQVMITTWSEDAARKFSDILAKTTFKVQRVWQSLDENIETQDKPQLSGNKYHKVWRVYATC